MDDSPVTPSTLSGFSPHGIVPASEIERRLEAFQLRLAAAGVGGALIVQLADLVYLSGTAQDAHLIVPSTGDARLLVRRSVARARAESALPVSPLESLRELPAALVDIEGPLGIEMDVLPAARYLDLRRRLGDRELVDISPLLRAVRACKSPWEIERIREAAGQLAVAAERVPMVLREGMTELDLAADVERALRLAGHEGIVRARAFNLETSMGAIVAGPSAAIPGGNDAPIVGPGMSAAAGKGTSLRPIGRGEPVVVDLIGVSAGYIADQTRTFSIGPLPRALAEAHEHAREILHAVAAAALPGVRGSQLYELAIERAEPRPGFMGAAGERAVSFVGHGVGLETDEYPFLARGWDSELEEGMVFALEPKFVVPGVGAVGIENTYVVEAGGARPLTTAPEELIEV